MTVAVCDFNILLKLEKTSLFLRTWRARRWPGPEKPELGGGILYSSTTEFSK
jgi:hypothetical protein